MDLHKQSNESQLLVYLAVWDQFLDGVAVTNQEAGEHWYSHWNGETWGPGTWRGVIESAAVAKCNKTVSELAKEINFA